MADDRIDCNGKVKPRTAKPQAMYYAATCLRRVQEIAGEHGFAVAVHGSLQNDLDLILVPWAFDARAPGPVIAQIAKEFSRWGEDGADGIHGPTMKPHGRLAWNVIVGGAFLFDISIMPRGARHEDARPARGGGG